ncbi:succinyl-diaminopimelate desuccinylase [Pseudoxanthobacter sp.]|uniref:succinyl-diaminopimelate desuccinylase n=1 Tax=Pseudoxanthobacter sp. TaxID=1925742 RepID=UPI002FDF23FD
MAQSPLADAGPALPDALALARRLIRQPSVTPDARGPLDEMEAVLSAAGFRVARPVFSEEGTEPVENLYARFGTGRPHIAFAGHVDVVPPGDVAAWRHDPFSGAVEDGALYGRGAVDMKGGIAAFMAAALGFLAKAGPDFAGSVSFLITGDEEGPSVNGTAKLLDWCAERGEVFDAALVGEPTCAALLGDTVKIGRRGSMSGTVTFRGVQGHVAYPERALNPLRALLAVAPALTEPPLDAGNAHFAPSNLEIVSVDTGNPSWNVIPAETRLRFNIRYNDLWTRPALEAELRRRLTAAATAAGVAVPELVLERASGDVFLTAPGPLVAALSGAIAAVTGVEPALTTGGGTSDARFIKDYCPVVEFGLVGTTMHKVDERVPVAELEQLAAVYAAFLSQYFAG